MRGKVPETYRYVAGYGITPAYAGKSLASAYNVQMDKDHPRVCGEKAAPSVLTVGAVGSPPRMRGKAFL